MAENQAAKPALGQVVDRDIMSQDGTAVLCKAGTIITPQLMLRLNNWELKPEPPKKEEKEEEEPREEKLSKRRILEKIGFLELSTPETRGRLEKSASELFAAVAEGAEMIDTGPAIEAIGALVSEVPDEPGAPLKLFDHFGGIPYMIQHSVECCRMGAYLAKALRYDDERVAEFAEAMLLHDIGLMTVPEAVLRKKVMLTDEEWNLVKSHSERGFEFLKRVSRVTPLSFIVVMGHHVQADGSGYPDHLRSGDMPLFAHLSTIVNDFEALTAEYRPYTEPAHMCRAVKMLLSGRWRYHPIAIESFLRVVGVYPVTSFVRLNSGDVGVVTRNNAADVFSPELILILDPAGNEYPTMPALNLFDEPDYFIEDVANMRMFG